MWRVLLAVLTIGSVLGSVNAAQGASLGGKDGPRVLIAFFPADSALGTRELDRLAREGREPVEATPVLDRLSVHPELALGLVGATQGTYSPEQALLDITQGTRVSEATYTPEESPQLGLEFFNGVPRIRGWLDARLRAESAPAEVVPGLLAGSIPGGAAFVAGSNGSWREAVVAADRKGFLGEASIVASGAIAARAQTLLDRYRLVVTELPRGKIGVRELDRLVKGRGSDELLIVMQAPPQSAAQQLLPIGVLGLPGGAGTLSSDSTRREGIVAGIDLLPTVLDYLGLSVPSQVKGRPLRVEPGRDAEALDDTDDRLRVIGPRRLPALQTIALSWLVLVLICGVTAGVRGVRAGVRIGALAVLWIPAVLLVTAVVEPDRDVELALITALTFGLAALTDRLLRWPRGPALPAIVALVAYTVDLAAGSDLIVNSLLGPNPRSGSRYFGIGNELESLLPLLLLVGTAALLGRRPRSRGAAAAFVLGGVALAIVIGSGRLGADVGGVITVAVGAAVATLLMLPGTYSRRQLALLLVAAPILGLLALALLDAVTGGDGHLTRTVLDAQSGGDVWDIVRRRYELAFNGLAKGAMPFLIAICALMVIYATRNKGRLYAAVRGYDSWYAALVAGVAAAVAGALFNDSGAQLLLFGVVLLADVTAYLRCGPLLGRTDR